jgi:hypothetical protein
MSGLVKLNLNPSDRSLRQFGFIALVVFGAMAVMAQRELMWFRGGLGSYRELVAAGLAGLGISSALFSLLAPRANRPLFVALSLAALPIGFVVSHVVMAVLFFLVIMPIGFLLKATGRDALRRRSKPEQATYWVKARSPRPIRDYFRQY